MKKSSCLVGVIFLFSGCLTGPMDAPSRTSPVPRANSQPPPKRISNKPSDPVSPPATPPASEDTPVPPPALSPDLLDGEQTSYVQETSLKIEVTEQTIARVDQKQLSKDQYETWVSVLNFLSKAKEALAANDLPRAKALAEKAQTLVKDLPVPLQK